MLSYLQVKTWTKRTVLLSNTLYWPKRRLARFLSSYLIMSRMVHSLLKVKWNKSLFHLSCKLNKTFFIWFLIPDSLSAYLSDTCYNDSLEHIANRDQLEEIEAYTSKLAIIKEVLARRHMKVAFFGRWALLLSEANNLLTCNLRLDLNEWLFLMDCNIFQNKQWKKYSYQCHAARPGDAQRHRPHN